MLLFDTLKISFPTLLIANINHAALTAYPDKKDKDKTIYHQRNIVPGLVAVRIGNTETAVEFSAKILGAQYPLLISTATIEAALTNLEIALPFSFDVHMVLDMAHTLKAHQKQDFSLLRPFGDYASQLAQLHVARTFTVKPYKDETLTFLQIVNGKEDKHREYFKLYDKEKEFRLPKHAEFRDTLSKAEKEAIIQSFKGKTHAETEFNSKRKLRQHYPDIDKRILLKDLLTSSSNPLAKQFTEITKTTYMTISNQKEAKTLDFVDSLTDIKEQQLFAHLAALDFDPSKLEMQMKQMRVADRTKVTKRKEYAAMLARYKAHELGSTSFAHLHELKDAITNPVPISYNYRSSVPILALPTSVEKTPLQEVKATAEPTPYNYRSLMPKMATSLEIPELVMLADEKFERELAVLPELEEDYLPW